MARTPITVLVGSDFIVAVRDRVFSVEAPGSMKQLTLLIMK